MSGMSKSKSDPIGLSLGAVGCVVRVTMGGMGPTPLQLDGEHLSQPGRLLLI